MQYNEKLIYYTFVFINTLPSLTTVLLHSRLASYCACDDTVATCASSETVVRVVQSAELG